jgi:hypothetical protein
MRKHLITYGITLFNKRLRISILLVGWLIQRKN